MLYGGYYKKDGLYFQSGANVVASNEIMAEQEQILAQLALRNSMHAAMTELYVQARVCIASEVLFIT